MKIISWNVNGIRATLKSGAFEQLEPFRFDILCLQEIKTQTFQLQPSLLDSSQFLNYHVYFNSAEKKGYSGVAVYSKQKPLLVEYKLGLERFDEEGRMLKLQYSDFILINLYLPHGGRQKENLDYKLKVYDHLLKCLEKIKNKKILLIGDFNVAHQEIDLAKPEENKNNIMFTPEERKQIDRLIKLGFTDTFRKFHKEGGFYTWWLYQLRERNIGWRIDYAFTSKSLTPKVRDVFILKEIRGSDHCPIGLTID
ncbi:MAG: exodeoxyribonuclease III [Patescibacteria group bacterium]